MIYSKNVKTGYYHVVNKEKCKNEKKILYYRSGLELQFMKIVDHSKNILEWSYEQVIVKYQQLQNINQNKKENYYIIDFWIKKKVNDVIKEYLIEIKPYSFLFPPEIPKRKTKQWIEKLENFSKIKAKCVYADEYAKKNNMEFVILTEKNLF